MKLKQHKVSKEELFHYQCCNCQQWWTIGDKKLTECYCPACGTKAKVKNCEANKAT